MAAVFLTGGARTRVIAEAHPVLAPLAAFEIHLSRGLPVATPEPSPSENPAETASPTGDATGTPPATP
jgi:hypothetical protein